MHQRFEALHEAAEERYVAALGAIDWADLTVRRLGLEGLLDPEICNHVNAYPEPLQGSRYILNIFVSPEAKAKVMRILTDSKVEKWRRSKLLSTSNHDGNSYRDWLYIDYDYCEEYGNRVTVRFATLANEGDEVDGCEVRTRKVEHTRLELSCELN